VSEFDLMLECTYRTQDWSVRVNHSLLGIVLVDSWLLYAGARGPLWSVKQRRFYETLALELIDNDYDSVGLRARTGGGVPGQLTPTSGVGPIRRRLGRGGATMTAESNRSGRQETAIHAAFERRERAFPAG
jgi:hypothetical protein